MSIFLVTVKLPKNPDHNPRDKKTGNCPVAKGVCTDVTGEHHTALSYADSIEEVKREFAGYHITRIEEVPARHSRSIMAAVTGHFDLTP